MTDEQTPEQARTTEELGTELQAKGHVNTSWEELGSITLPVTEIETSQYRIGPPDDPESPTVFKVYFPPDCRVSGSGVAPATSTMPSTGSAISR